MSFWIGVDVGGTNIVCGIVNEKGEVLDSVKKPTEASLGSSSVLDKIAQMSLELAAGSGLQNQVAGIGIGIPGLVDPWKGIAQYSANLNWRDIPLSSELTQRTSLPVYIDNDVRMYVYGEAVYGAGQGVDFVLGLTIGTGLSAAMVNRGQLYYGHLNLAGEIGHGPMDGESAPCGCGFEGCLEAAASASGMVREAKRYIHQGRKTILTEWFPGERLQYLSAADLSKAMDAGDVLAAEIINHAGELLGKALVPTIHLLSPEVIIIGGGGANAGERLLTTVRGILMTRLLPDYRQHVSIRTASLGDGAGVIGSAMQAKQRHSIMS
ncbi:ROK family protein [Paenibacillus dakarensis]|uniref:ROK family protein n=1 Tax=Paenibacillus dakarensis TaxID=1527293 RepID=UPI0006D53A65|nr:ROK family protein [Paenibacillus dakarensis]